MKFSFYNYASCSKCGAMHRLPIGSMHFAPRVCPECGADRSTFQSVVARMVWDGVWYKPWTWGDTHYQIRESN